MNHDDIGAPKLDVERIASRNPAIDISRFSSWQRKMARIRRLAPAPDIPHGLQPENQPPPVPNGQGLYREGNLLGMADRVR